jgi:hypothetical protein
MTGKTSVAAMLAGLEDLKAAMAQAKVETGETSVIFVNDPESEELLRPHRKNLDQSQTFVIGVFPQPGTEP